MTRRKVVFREPFRVEVEEGLPPLPGPDQLLVGVRFSAISPGTEMLVYQGQWPPGVPLDATITSLAGPFHYPLSYGYATVGRVLAQGEEVPDTWLGRRVFAFHPHESLFAARPDALYPIPDDIDDQTALFLPAMETAVTLLLDGAPLIGEEVVVSGQGIVGLLTTALLTRFPLTSLITLDCHAIRREASLRLGATDALDPAEDDAMERLGAATGSGGQADLVYELSGNPAALDPALGLCRFSGRVVVGSWYGAKRVSLDLGSFFHRGRVTLISSQVSTIAPALSGRWQGERRIAVAWEMLRQVRPASLISHSLPLAEAALAYDRIHRAPGETIQVILDHSIPTES